MLEDEGIGLRLMSEGVAVDLDWYGVKVMVFTCRAWLQGVAG